MSPAGTVRAARASEVKTLGEALRRTVVERGDRIAIRTVGGEVTWTWRDLGTKVDACAAGLHALGVRPGDRVGLLLGNRPEFHLVDLAITTVGATPFSIYMTSSPVQIAYVVEDAAARVLITESAFLEPVLEARRELASLELVVVVDGAGPDGCLSLDDVLGRADGTFDAAASTAALQPDDLATLIYTSGTTGPPKGVELTYRNVMATLLSTEQLIPLPEDGRVISWLPNAHIAERVAHHYLPVLRGLEITCCPDPRRIIEVLPSVDPSWFFAVPRIWEKLKAGLEARFAALDDDARVQMEQSIAAGVRKVRLEQAGLHVPEALAAQVAQADATLFSALRVQLGLDQALAVHVGAAPTPLDVLEFFHAIGIPLAEVWGMSETCGGAACNPPDSIKLGTVGPASPGVELRLADDGEVLVRGEVVMRGYHGMPDATAAAIDADGWLHTGDIGELDADGYLKIIDRKKELIINSAGKNMSPALIEAVIKSASPLIGQAVCIGDARPYNTALVVLDPDFAGAWADRRGVADPALASLATDPELLAEIESAVQAANARLSRVEQIKRFTVIAGEWLPGGDELTPTMKLMRKPIADKYAEQIAAMYR